MLYLREVIYGSIILDFLDAETDNIPTDAPAFFHSSKMTHPIGFPHFKTEETLQILYLTLRISILDEELHEIRVWLDINDVCQEGRCSRLF